ncbi:MAG TPA: hypothetical protein DCG87_02865 [Synergistaceae bacterium]|nr:hypothetical protein [Synergistaceae bacterium]
MTTSDMDPEDPVYLASHNNLLLSFLDREMLGKDDLSLMRSLGVSFRGKRGWAQFRRMRGLRHEGRITSGEADLLLEVIPRVLTMAETAKRTRMWRIFSSTRTCPFSRRRRPWSGGSFPSRIHRRTYKRCSTKPSPKMASGGSAG